MPQLPAKILNADRIVTLIGASPTIFTAYANSYRTVFD